MLKGRLKSWNGQKGFGFIQSDSAEQDIFVHISALNSMARKPLVGDVIYFDIERQADGKIRATNCEAEGVLTVNQTQPVHISKKPSSSSIALKFVVVMLCLIGVFVYQKMIKTQTMLLPVQTAETMAPIITQSTDNVRCDDRQHCSQMTSREEA
ncbi:cold shock domain-containing protein [Paraglaciecola sp.]|uniref:cold shock domain-containing protein n=1 Tax=Paraglaciecola sp. TaxID=1920173 RepID=UPI0030F49C1C